MHGTRYANYAVSQCDLLPAVGARFDDRSRIWPVLHLKPGIHIDVDAAEIGKTYPPHIPIVGDVKQVLSEIIPRVRLDPYEPNGMS